MLCVKFLSLVLFFTEYKVDIMIIRRVSNA